METRGEKKRTPGGVKALIVIFTLLFLLVGVPYLYMAFGGFPYTTAAESLSAPALTTGERYAFHPESRTMEISIEPSDLWWIVENTDVAEDMTALTETLSQYGLALKRYGLSFTTEGVVLDAKLLYKGFLPLPIRVTAGLSLTGRNLHIAPKMLYLGRLIKIPPESLPFDTEDLALTVELAKVHDRLKQLTGMRTEDGRLILTCGVGKEIVAEMLANMGQVEDDCLYLGEQDAGAVAREAATGTLGAAFDTAMNEFARNPAYYGAFKTAELVDAEDFQASLYFGCQDAKYLPRFLPEVSKENVARLSEERDREKQTRREALIRVVKALDALNKDRQIALDATALINLSADKAPLSLNQFQDGPTVKSWLIEEGMRFILGSNANYYMTQALDPINKMPVENKAALKRLNGNEKYVPLLLIKTADGQPAVAYSEKGGTFTLRLIGQQQYHEMMNDTNIPVYELQLED